MSREIKNYLPVNRKFFEHPFWTKERVYSEAEAWLYLLKEARFEVSEASIFIKGKIVRWGRGELPASLRYLGLKWSWDKNKVDRFLKLLMREGMIKSRTACGTDQTIITLCNYDSYNGAKENEGQQTGRKRDTDGTDTGQTRDNTNTDNKGKNDKKEKKVECAPLVFLTEKEFTSLNTKHGSYAAMQMISKLSAFKESNGKKYVSDYGAINSWVVDWWNEHGRKQIPSHINPQTGATKLVM